MTSGHDPAEATLSEARTLPRCPELVAIQSALPSVTGEQPSAVQLAEPDPAAGDPRYRLFSALLL